VHEHHPEPEARSERTRQLGGTAAGRGLRHPADNSSSGHRSLLRFHTQSHLQPRLCELPARWGAAPNLQP